MRTEYAYIPIYYIHIEAEKEREREREILDIPRGTDLKCRPQRLEGFVLENFHGKTMMNLDVFGRIGRDFSDVCRDSLDLIQPKKVKIE